MAWLPDDWGCSGWNHKGFVGLVESNGSRVDNRDCHDYHSFRGYPQVWKVHFKNIFGYFVGVACKHVFQRASSELRKPHFSYG